MKYYSCDMIEYHLTIEGRIDEEGAIRFCCESIEGRPAISLFDTPEETIRNFLGMKAWVKAEGLKKEKNPKFYEKYESLCTKACDKCKKYQNKEWHTDGLIHHVSLAMYPAPCQCRCVYCSVINKEQNMDKDEVRIAYDKIFEMIEYIKNTGIIHPNALWQVSTGEITIHPFKDRILDLVKDSNVIFYTNCFKFDQRIGEILRDNPKAKINLSIDSGTPDTWKKVKGYDNFEKVMGNLTEYYNYSTKEGQITLKYIILPGINDTIDDYRSLMDIIKILEVSELQIAYDFSKKYNMNTRERRDLMGALAYLMALCKKNGVRYSAEYSYTPDEIIEAEKLTKEIIEKNLI